MNYPVEIQLQPTNHSCGQAAFATLLSYYGDRISAEEYLSEAPVNKDADGNDIGSINQVLATHAITRGHKVTIHTADFQLLDMSWVGLGQAELLSKIKQVRGHREIDALGEHWVNEYIESYIEFIEAGGTLKLVQYFDETYLDTLLASGPILPAVSTAVLYGEGHFALESGLRELKLDDIDGVTGTHSVVVYGKDENENYLLADPWHGNTVVEPAALIAAITAAQIECDSLIVAIN